MRQDLQNRIQSLELKATADGSSTLFVPELNEHYHSVHGALNESMHVFIAAGLQPLLNNNPPEIKIFEVGFGTGLNAILTYAESEKTGTRITYDTVEAFPLPDSLIAELDFSNVLNNQQLHTVFTQLHDADWNSRVSISPDFSICKLNSTLQEAKLQASEYNLIYFDAFAPDKQPELWNDSIFFKLRQAMQPGAILVTYCAKGIIKRRLDAAGFLVETIPGPPGKREMIRAVRKDF